MKRSSRKRVDESDFSASTKERPELPQSNSGLFYITILHLFCDTKKSQTFSDEELANQYFLLVDN